MRCFKCGSSDIIRVKIDDGTEIIQCNDCGAKMTIEKNDNEKPVLEEKESMTELKVVAPPKAKTVSPVNQMVKKMQPVLNDVKVWIKNPVSIVSVVINGVLLMLSVVLLVLCCNTGTSAKDEIRDYAVANGYQLADFDKFNSPASENGLGNSKVYFSGKVKELKKIGSFNVALVEENDNSNNVWGVIFLDNYIYSQLKKGKKVTVFGYYSGYSEKLKAPDVYYANGYMDNKWYEYDDSLGVLASFEENKTKKLIEDGEFIATKDEIVDAINTIENVTYIPKEYKGGTTYFYSGMIEKGVECSITCETDGETVRAIQIITEYDTAKEATTFFLNLVKVLDPDSYEKNVTRIRKKWDLDNIKYGDTATCIVDDVYYVADFSKENEVVLSIMPVGNK